MKKLLFSILVMICALAQQSTAQNVLVTSTSGTTTFAQFSTLKEAFDSLNNGYQTGTITIQITGNISEGSATARLDSSGTVSTGGTAAYTSVSISPVGGSWTISGNPSGGNPLIDLNGADHVTIDGLANGSDSLTISNTTGSSTSNTSTIRLINDAQYNTITNVTILTGFTSASLTSNGGGLHISTSATGGSGNDHNTISNCYFSNASALAGNFSYKFLYISGTSTDSSQANSDITIHNNHFVNFKTAGVYINNGARKITISQNHFYHSITTSSASTFAPIYVNASASNIGEGITITGNYIGGSAPFCGGNMPTMSLSSYFQVIYVASATTAPCYISGNTINNINIQTTYSSTEAGLVYIKTGRVNIENNLMGSLTDTSSLIITHNSSSGGTYSFITIGGNSAGTFDTIVVNHNTMSGITLKTLGSNAPSLRGFDNAGSTGTFLLTNNRWGIPGMANSIQVMASNGNYFGAIFRNSNSNSNQFVNNYIGNWTCYASATTNGRMRGLSINTSEWRADSNTIENLVAYTANPSTTANVQAVGIFNSGLKGSCIGNTIKNIIAANPSSLSSAVGMDLTTSSGVSDAVVAGNKISNIYALSSDSSLVIGMKMRGSGTSNITVHNNQISLGKDSLGMDITNGHRFYGIALESGNAHLYYNSILVDGALASNTVNTYAFSSISSDTTDIRNNVFVNQRSFANSPLTTANYAANYDGSISVGAIPNFTINFNLYFANGIGGMVISNNGTSYFDLNTWKSSAFFHDANSVSGTPDFIAYDNLEGGSSTSIATGDFGLGITIDITNTPRVYNLMGAYDLSLAVPVELLFVEAHKLKNDVMLTWATASETNNRGFEVERSLDGTKFESIGFVKGKMNTTARTNYTYADVNVFFAQQTGTLYYRLKQLDNDGQFDYSKTVSVSTKATEQKVTTTLYPNPFKDVLTLHLSSAQSTLADIRIVDMAGMEVNHFSYQVNEGSSDINLGDNNLKTGIYFVVITINGEKQTHKLIKQ
jgi:hypothetical protein